MKRYEKIVLDVERGITFEVSEGTSGELIIRALNNASINVYSVLPTVSAGKYAKVLSIYTDRYGNKAIVPPGWTVSGIEEENTIWGKNKSLVIYSIPQEKVNDIAWWWITKKQIESVKETYNQLVWVPVEKLDCNGTLDGKHFSERFGRRNYMNDEFSDDGFSEALNGELLEQLKSVQKYGGFYISRYNISKSSAGKPQSVKGVKPWVDITFADAKKIASTIENSEAVKSHLTFGAEYDSVLEWFIKTEVKTLGEITDYSVEWGNYFYTENSPRKIVETGSREKWCVNNIYDFTGNVYEWTQEQKYIWRVTRGGNWCDDIPVAFRKIANDCPYNNYTGFRVTLYIK